MSLFEINAEIMRPRPDQIRELARTLAANLSDAMADLFQVETYPLHEQYESLKRAHTSR